MSSCVVQPLARPPDVELTLPGSKSFTNRALLIAALAEGRSRVREALLSDDTRHMGVSLRALGFAVDLDEARREYSVDGEGGRIPAGEATLDVGNAGTAARFLTAALALGSGRYLLDGSARMRQRPAQPLLDALGQLGARAYAVNGDGCPPIVVEGGPIRGGRVAVDSRQSSQFASALCLVGPVLRGGLVIEVTGGVVSEPFLRLTAASMRAFGAAPEVESSRRSPRHHRATDWIPLREYLVEPDATAASYFLAAAAVTHGRVRVLGLGRDSAQGDLGFVELLSALGASCAVADEHVEVVGPSADVVVSGLDVDMGPISDTWLTLAAVAPFASEPVTIRGVAHTRHQESDRVSAMATELRRLGARVDEAEDGLTVHPSASSLHGAHVQTYDDHRIAMSLALVGLRVPGVVIEGAECVSKTFPEYFATLERLRQEPIPSP